MTITYIPFDNLPGKIYRSPMPFGGRDQDGQALDEMKRSQVSVIVMLASDEEARDKASRNLRELYLEEGIQVVYFPIPDFQVPKREALNQVLEQTIDLARQGKNVAVHCSAGWGRTGLFMVELAKKVKQIPGREALNFVRGYVPQAVETSEQEAFVLEEER